MASVSVGNRIYYGVGTMPDFTLKDLQNGMMPIFESDEGHTKVQNYTVSLPNGSAVPKDWAVYLGVPH